MDKPAAITSEALDRALLLWMQELSPHGICVTDTNLHIQTWNLWLESASGFKRDQVVGRHIFEVFPELRGRRLDAHFERAVKGEVSVLSTALHKHLLAFPSTVADADYPHMLQTARIAPLLRGLDVVGTITTIEDVTQREFQNALLRRQNARQELFSWALAHLLRSSDPDTMVKMIFPRVAAQMGVDVYFNYMLETDGQFHLHSAAGVAPTLKRQVAVAAPGGPWCEASAPGRQTFVLSDIQKGNSSYAALQRQIGLQAYVCQPLRVDDKIIGTLAFGSRTRERFDDEEVDFTKVISQYVAIAIDRSRTLQALRKAQEELSRHAESLEKKVQERTGKLQETIAELETFSYSLAHDVRAPLRHIHAYAQLLEEACGTALNEEGSNYLASIVRSIQKLDLLTKDILAYSQVSRRAIEMNPVDVEAIIQNIIARNPVYSEAGVLNVQLPLPAVLGERVLLDQSIGNLLDNALKFVPPGVAPQIVIRAEAIASNGDHCRPLARIWIEDNGIGIAPEFHGKIFDIFERLSNHAQGTGIGLAIVSKAIHRMGGRVGVESQAGKGSRFWIELPLAG